MPSVGMLCSSSFYALDTGFQRLSKHRGLEPTANV
jgi:hypothetical protein